MRMSIVLVIQQVYVCADYLDSRCGTQTYIQAHERASVHHHDCHFSREVTWEVQDHWMHLSRAEIVTHVYMSKDLFLDMLEKWISAGTKVFSTRGRNKILRPKFNNNKSYRAHHRDFWEMMSGVRWDCMWGIGSKKLSQDREMLLRFQTQRSIRYVHVQELQNKSWCISNLSRSYLSDTFFQHKISALDD